MRDVSGVVHRVQFGPEPFMTMPGGLPGRALCGVLFYDAARGPESCLTGVRRAYAVSMVPTEDPVNCMTCLVRECR